MCYELFAYSLEGLEINFLKNSSLMYAKKIMDAKQQSQKQESCDL
jgi:hypothetical protein